MFFVDMILGLYENAVYNLMFSLIYGPLFFLHHEQKYYSVRNLFSIIMIGFVSYMSVITFHQGRLTETENIMYGVFAGAMFMYSGKSRIFVLFTIVGIFFGLKYYKFHYFETPLNSDFSLTIINSTIALIGILFFMTVFESEFKKTFNHVIELNLDLISQKRLLEQSKIELDDINKTNTKLFSIIAHDLKNPLNLLNGLVHLTGDEDVTAEEMAELKFRTQENLNTVIHMIDNVLIWAKSHLEGFVPKFTTQNLAKMCNDLIIFYEDILVAKQLQLSINIDPALEVKSDSTLLKIVIRNIINNAIKYTERSGEIKICAAQNENYVELRISDSGVGMCPQTITSIENGDFVESQYGTEDEIGTGLGLLLSIEMLKKTNSQLKIESELGEGTTIKIIVPKAITKHQKLSLA